MPAYYAQVGSAGSGSNGMEGPNGVAVDAKGDIWVADTGNRRVVEYNAQRKFVAAYGFGVSNGKNEYQICTSGCESGIAGSSPGQFYFPYGIAIDGKGNVWVLDSGNGRIVKLNEKGEYQGEFGSAGEGAGQMSTPYGITVDSKGNVWGRGFA